MNEIDFNTMDLMPTMFTELQAQGRDYSQAYELIGTMIIEDERVMAGQKTFRDSMLSLAGRIEQLGYTQDVIGFK